MWKFDEASDARRGPIDQHGERAQVRTRIPFASPNTRIRIHIHVLPNRSHLNVVLAIYKSVHHIGSTSAAIGCSLIGSIKLRNTRTIVASSRIDVINSESGWLHVPFNMLRLGYGGDTSAQEVLVARPRYFILDDHVTRILY